MTVYCNLLLLLLLLLSIDVAAQMLYIEANSCKRPRPLASSNLYFSSWLLLLLLLLLLLTQMLHVDADSRKESGPLPVNPALDKYRAMPGVHIEISPLPYNPSTDCALSKFSQQVVAEDTAWEKLKGSQQYIAWRIREKQALEVLPRGVVSDLAGGGGGSNGGPKRLLLRGGQ
jgi:hypothetical protein